MRFRKDSETIGNKPSLLAWNGAWFGWASALAGYGPKTRVSGLMGTLTQSHFQIYLGPPSGSLWIS